MSSSSRGLTAWDMAALRMSKLYAQDTMPEISRPPSLKTIYGVRNLPISTGSAEDLGVPGSLIADETADDVLADADEMRMRSRRDALDLFDMSFILKQDTLAPLALHKPGLSDTTIQLRRRQRVVDGSIERQSPYWKPRKDVRGPMRARIPLVDRDVERLDATFRRSVLAARTKKAKTQPQEEETYDAEGEGNADDRIAAIVQKALPRASLWTNTNEETWREGQFGWAYTQRQAECIPNSSLLKALHYYAAQFFHTNGALSTACVAPTPSDTDARTCEQIRDECATEEPIMEPGTELWEYWARHSLGCGHTMINRLDAGALIALATFVETYAQALVPKQMPSDTLPSRTSLKNALHSERRRPRRSDRANLVRNFFVS